MPRRREVRACHRRISLSSCYLVGSGRALSTRRSTYKLPRMGSWDTRIREGGGSEMGFIQVEAFIKTPSLRCSGQRFVPPMHWGFNRESIGGGKELGCSGIDQHEDFTSMESRCSDNIVRVALLPVHYHFQPRFTNYPGLRHYQVRCWPIERKKYFAYRKKTMTTTQNLPSCPGLLGMEQWSEP